MLFKCAEIVELVEFGIFDDDCSSLRFLPTLPRSVQVALWSNDRNGDGKIDAIGYDTNGDGRVNLIEYDNTGDGKVDTLAYDLNGH